MSLLDEYTTHFKLMVQTSVPDGEGGYTTSLVEGEAFNAAITFDSSTQGRTAEHAGVTALYTVTTVKEIVLEFHDVIKRVKDGKIFRITSNGDDNATPASAGINMRQVSAEGWALP